MRYNKNQLFAKMLPLRIDVYTDLKTIEAVEIETKFIFGETDGFT